jgi:hypothetical protein
MKCIQLKIIDVKLMTVMNGMPRFIKMDAQIWFNG